MVDQEILFRIAFVAYATLVRTIPCMNPPIKPIDSEDRKNCVFLAIYLCLAKELESLKLLEQPANWH